MSLKRRLDSLRRQAGGATPAAPPAGDLRLRLERLGGRAAAARTAPGGAEAPAVLARRLGGELVAEQLILVERRLPLSERHGHWPLSDWQAEGSPLGALPQRVAYVDTETTGLAGGTGTLAFMVGIAEPGRAEVRLRQWLLTAFAGEAALLEALAEALAGVELIVSYNGKSFDLPLLRDRRRLQRAAPLPEPAHLDLLHPVRRLYGRRWADCRLASVERRLLGLQRQDDLPGAEAPLAWRAFLAGDRNHPLDRVLRHNALDVLSLVALPPALGAALRAPQRFDADPAAAAELWVTAGNRARALELLLEALPRLDPRGRHLLARQLRQAGRLEEAAALWEQLAAAGCPQATEQLAKYHEHVRRDWQRALSYAERLGDGPASRHRRQRLRARLAERQARLDL